MMASSVTHTHAPQNTMKNQGCSESGRASSVDPASTIASAGSAVWQRRLDPTSELVLTILSQNSADVNAERAFESLRAAFPSGAAVETHEPGRGWEKLYVETVLGADSGADLDFLVGSSGDAVARESH